MDGAGDHAPNGPPWMLTIAGSGASPEPAGETIHITRNGVEVAELRPLARRRRLSGADAARQRRRQGLRILPSAGGGDCGHGVDARPGHAGAGRHPGGTQLLERRGQGLLADVGVPVLSEIASKSPCSFPMISTTACDFASSPINR